jgi:predicted YcjX-like family ATPase
MKATEIVEKLKDVLLGSQEVENQEEIKEELSATEEVVEEVNESPEGEEVVLSEGDQLEQDQVVEAEEEATEASYVTKEEFAELKAMVESLMGEIKSTSEKYNSEVPKEELAAVEADVEPMVHTPEAKAEVEMKLFSQNRRETTLDRVLNNMSKFNK